MNSLHANVRNTLTGEVTATAWVGLESVLLSERSRSEKEKYHVTSLAHVGSNERQTHRRRAG